MLLLLFQVHSNADSIIDFDRKTLYTCHIYCRLDPCTPLQIGYPTQNFVCLHYASEKTIRRSISTRVLTVVLDINYLRNGITMAIKKDSHSNLGLRFRSTYKCSVNLLLVRYLLNSYTLCSNSLPSSGALRKNAWGISTQGVGALL